MSRSNIYLEAGLKALIVLEMMMSAKEQEDVSGKQYWAINSYVELYYNYRLQRNETIPKKGETVT
jgi:hypothetical protein